MNSELSLEEIISILRENPFDVKETLITLNYEISDIGKCILRAERYPELRQVYLKEAEIAISDSIAQLLILCHQMNLSFERLGFLGIQRLRERAKERRRRYGDKNSK